MYIINEVEFNRTETTAQNKSLTIREYLGTSLETKPTLAVENTGSTFLAVNTALHTTELYVWHESAWYIV